VVPQRPTASSHSVTAALGASSRRSPSGGRGVASRVLVAVATRWHALPDLLAFRAHRVLLGVTTGHPHLAAQRDDGRAVDHRVDELVLGHVVREPLVVAVVAVRRNGAGLFDRACSGAQLGTHVGQSKTCPVFHRPGSSRDSQFIVGSSGKVATSASSLRCRRRTRRHRPAGSSVNGSSGSASRTYQPPSLISISSWPGPHPA